MILLVTVESFLNFEGKLVGEISRLEDNGKFTVLFGRNGSGKSSLVTAIIWCLFDKQKSSKKLINSKDFSKGTNQCSVTVRLCCQQETCSTIDVTKTYKVKGNSVAYRATYSTCHDTSNNFSDVTITNEVEIRSILQNKFNLNTESIDRVYCAQSSEHLQSLKDPLELLRFVETCIGTISLKHEYEFLQGQVAEKSESIQVAMSQSERNVESVTSMLPKIHQALKFVKDSIKLNQSLISIYIISIGSMNKLLDGNAMEKQRIELSLEALNSEKCEQEMVSVASNTRLDQYTIECEKCKKLVNQVTKLKKKLEANEQSEGELIAETKEAISKLKKKHKYALGQLTAVQGKAAVNAKEIKVLETDLLDNQRRVGEVSAKLDQFLDTDIQAVKRENGIIRSIKERYETTGVQTLMQTLETKRTLRDEWNTTNIIHSRSIEGIDAAIKVLTRDLNTKELEAICLSKDVSTFEQYALDINKAIIRLRQQLQTRNNSIFLTNASIKINKLLSSVTVDCSILCNVALPKEVNFTRAIIACVGYNRLPTTIIVTTRKFAVDIAVVAKRLGVSGVLIEIIDEYDAHTSTKHTPQAAPANFIPLMDCITFLDKRVVPIFAQKYKNTYLFNGTAKEMLAELHNMTDNNYCSYASLDGCRVKPGGEIITSNQNNDIWPLVSTTKSDSTSNVSVVEIEHELTHQYQAQSENSLRANYATENKKKVIEEIKEMEEIVLLKEGEKNAIFKKIVSVSRCDQLQSDIDNLEVTLAKANHSISELSNQESARMQMLTNHPVFSKINQLLQKQLLASNSVDKLSMQLKILVTDKSYLEKREKSCKDNISTIAVQLDTSNQSLNEATKSYDDIERKLTKVADDFSTQMKKYESAMKDVGTAREESKLAEQLIKKLDFSMTLLQQDLHSIAKSSATTKKNIEATQLTVDECNRATRDLKSCTLLVFHKRVLETCWNRKIPRIFDDDNSPRLMLEDTVDGKDYYDSDDDDQDIIFDENGGDDVDRELKTTPAIDNSDSDSQKLYEKQLLLRQKVFVNSEMASSWKSIYKTYNAYCDRQIVIRDQIKLLQDDIKLLLASIHDVQSNRLDKISNGLNDISTSLTAIYKTLVTESDCYLSYSNVGSILYEEGVKIFTSYSNQHYKEIKHLSGGQQSTVSLSLLFAIHSCFSSSVFIFDEIDASLDTRTVGRLGIMIKNLSLKYNTSTFLVVSHRSEMIEMATRILGLYHSKNKPQIISKVF